MSSGPNQRYRPRFLQKPFGIRPKHKEIWVFARDVHLGKRLKDLVDRDERQAAFPCLSRYGGATIAQLLRYDDDWTAIEALRAAGVARLGLTSDAAA